MPANGNGFGSTMASSPSIYLGLKKTSRFAQEHVTLTLADRPLTGSLPACTRKLSRHFCTLAGVSRVRGINPFTPEAMILRPPYPGGRPAIDAAILRKLPA